MNVMLEIATRAGIRAAGGDLLEKIPPEFRNILDLLEQGKNPPDGGQ